MAKMIACLICGLEVSNKNFSRHHKLNHPKLDRQRLTPPSTKPHQIRCSMCEDVVSKST